MKTLKSSAALILILLITLTGCKRNPNSSSWLFLDGTAADASQEITDMGTAINDLDGFGSSPKMLNSEKSAADTIHYSRVEEVEPWAYTAGWWTRTRNITHTINGQEKTVEKIDSVQFLDAAGTAQQFPSWATTDSVAHLRSVERVGAWATHHLNLAMGIKISIGTDTTGTWNGLITGTLNGEALTSTSVNDVVRKRGLGYWKFPESGTINMDRPLRKIDVVFKGSGQATATITRKWNDEQKVIEVDISEGSESES